MQKISADWWARIITSDPHCTYYFGPFQTSEEVKNAYHGYVEDLDLEGARGIVVIIERSQPNILTICQE
ncbi:MAG: hypothetical protein RLZZ74_3321 [Cyanobacteriota bacterium]|jgi:hypothetical protein